MPPAEVENLFAVLRDLRSRGVALLYVSHRLDEIFALADVLREMGTGTIQSGGGNGAEMKDALMSRLSEATGRTVHLLLSAGGGKLFPPHHPHRPGPKNAPVLHAATLQNLVVLTEVLRHARSDSWRSVSEGIPNTLRHAIARMQAIERMDHAVPVQAKVLAMAGFWAG